MTYHVCSHCWGGSNKEPTIEWEFSGTRAACRRFIGGRGNHGFYFITKINSLAKVRRRYGH